ncbi:MAG TPA: CopG family antitoxin [Candidatus Paceibacterota bacterium]
MTEKNKKTNRIPEFSSIEEEAKFWDTHSTADFEDEFKPVKVKFGKNLSVFRLDPKTTEQLNSLATAKGVDITTLIRMWIKEHLKKNSYTSTFSVRDGDR